MSQAIQALESAALLLPAEERARLAERLLASLDTDPEMETAWAAEVERLTDWDAGLVDAVSWDEARRQMQAVLKGR
jgi:putative addiction module component (TIGR02574 family)